uniref:Uncharacterized protein n=1 Tax=Anguilla anguilla TaxID=7936 RepID=A0A0E9RQA6_ANGAN
MLKWLAISDISCHSYSYLPAKIACSVSHIYGATKM